MSHQPLSSLLSWETARVPSSHGVVIARLSSQALSSARELPEGRKRDLALLNSVEANRMPSRWVELMGERKSRRDREKGRKGDLIVKDPAEEMRHRSAI